MNQVLIETLDYNDKVVAFEDDGTAVLVCVDSVGERVGADGITDKVMLCSARHVSLDIEDVRVDDFDDADEWSTHLIPFDDGETVIEIATGD